MSTTEAPPSKAAVWWRVLALVVLTVAVLGAAHAFGVQDWLTRGRIRSLMLDLGPLGFVAYLALFALGELAHIPGMVFVSAAILAYGAVLGFLAAFVGSLVSVTTSFWVVRLVGGQPLGLISNPRLRRVLDHLEERPIRTIAVLRVLLWLAPALNYTLALSRVGFRDYLIGSAIGLVPPLVVAAVVFDWLFS